MRLNRSLAAAMLLAGSGIALAQQVPFTNLGSGVMGPFGQPAQVVAKSQAEFDAAGLGQLLDPAALIAPIDWQNEMVVAVKMGTRTSGGHSTRITGIRRQQLPHIMIFPPPPPVYELVVDYRETSPPAGSIVTMVITSPFHMVRLARHDIMIRFELETPPPAAVFNSAWFEYDTGPIGATGEGVHVDVQSNGRVSVSRYSPTALYQPVDGTANAAELQRLESAIRNARAASLPNPVPAGVVFIVAPPGFRLAVFSDRPQLNGSTTGTLGHYEGSNDARVRPLVDAFKAIADRVLQDASGSVYTGRIDLPPGGGIRLIDSNGGGSYRITPQATASELAQWRGKTVRLRGALQSSGPGMQLRVTEVVSPTHRSLDGVGGRENGRLVVLLGSPFQTAGLRAVRTFGDASSALRLAQNKTVHCDAWVFTDDNGRETEARIDSIEGEMRATSRLFDGSNLVGVAQQGEGIHVLGLSSTGYWMKIKSQAGIGWLRSNRVEVGGPLPPHPAPVPLTTGMVNAIPGQ